MQMLRLGYLVPDWPNQTHAFFWREVRALRDLGVEVHLFSTRRPPREQCSHDFAQVAHDTTYYVFPPSLGATFSALVGAQGAIGATLAYIRSLSETQGSQKLRIVPLALSAAGLAQECRKRNIAHLHVHSFANSAHLAALCKLLGGPPFSITLHGDLPIYGTDHLAKIRDASFISTVTIPLRNQVIDVLRFPEDRVVVIPMGVDTEYFCPLSKKRRTSETQATTFLTVARLNPTKGHKYVLEAVKRCKDSGLNLKYIIAGDGPHREAIKKQIDELKIADVVNMLGNISEQQVLELLRTSDAFILASEGLGEAAPVSVMEAMSCALPVICSRIGGTQDMIIDGVDGLMIDQRDVDALESAMRELILDSEKRSAIGAAARAKACAAFGFRANAAKLRAEIVTGTLSDPSSPARL